jgi:hypothetical protein
MPDHSPDLPTTRRQGLFPREAEVARRLSQSEKRWRHIARQLEREGLPKIDPIMDDRFWPAVAIALARAARRCRPVQQAQWG